MSDKPEPRLNGCHNRHPFATEYPLTGGGMQRNVFADGVCQYTKSNLGRVDAGCTLCTWRQE